MKPTEGTSPIIPFVLPRIAKRKKQKASPPRGGFEREIYRLAARNGVSDAVKELNCTLLAATGLLKGLPKNAHLPALAVAGLAHVLDGCAIKLARIALVSEKGSR